MVRLVEIPEAGNLVPVNPYLKQMLAFGLVSRGRRCSRCAMRTLYEEESYHLSQCEVLTSS